MSWRGASICPATPKKRPEPIPDEVYMLSGLSPMHLLLILFIVLAVFGTSKLRNIGRDLGGAVKGFKDAMREGEQPPQQLGQQQQATPPTLDQHKHDKV